MYAVVHYSSPFAAPQPWYDEHGPCCWESANTEGESCSCWVPTLYPEPDRDENGRPVTETGPPELRHRACGDCAFRKDSPERQAIDGERLDYGVHRPFVCHEKPRDFAPDSQMPKVTVWVHPPSGETFRPTEDDYKPIQRGAFAYMADGSIAPLCAGWGRQNGLQPPRNPRRKAAT